MKRRTAPVKHHPVVVKPSKRRFRFISETINELRKVVWLTRREAIYLTTLVLVVATATGLVLWVLDLGFTQIVNGLLGR